MEYEPKIIPEGINTSKEHPLREFFVLFSGIAAVIVVVIIVLTVSTDYLIRYIPLEKENEWFSNEMLADNKIPGSDSNSPLESEIEQYLQQLIEQLRQPGKPDYRFTVDLLHDQAPNAFIVPGGHIFVTSGLLESVESENGLAMVLAHEMAHQYHRHPLRGLGRGIVISLALIVISGAEGGGLVENFIGSTATLTSLGFSREQEREADKLGIELLMRHYGHSSGAGEFFEAVAKYPEKDTEAPGFLSTHPGIDERIDMLRTHSRQFGGDKTSRYEAIDRYLENIDSN